MDNEKSPQTPSPRPPNEGQPHEIQAVYFSAHPPKGEGVSSDGTGRRESLWVCKTLHIKGPEWGEGSQKPVPTLHPFSLAWCIQENLQPLLFLFTNKTIPFPTDK